MKIFFSCIYFLLIISIANAQVTKVDNNNNLWSIDIGSKIILINASDSSLYRMDANGSSAYQYSTKAKFGFGESYVDTLNGKLLLSGRTDAYGDELWATDGTDAGTVMIKDINPDVSGSNIQVLASMNGLAYFNAENAEYGRELWVTDGTTTGTGMVKDINPGPEGIGFGFAMIKNNGILYLIINDMIHGHELWRTDGTEAGTWMVKDINQNINIYGASSICTNEAQQFVNVGNSILFTAFDGVNGYGLWKSDGTETGTQMLALMDTSQYWFGGGSNFYKFNDKFFLNNGTSNKLWVTDGSVNGSSLIKNFKDLYNGTGYINFEGSSILKNAFIYKVKSNMGDSAALWKTDIINYETKQFFKDSTSVDRNISLLPKFNFYLTAWIHPFSYYDSTTMNGKLFMTSLNVNGNNKLWITDGETVTYLKDFKWATYEPFYYRYTSDGFYFAADDSFYGNELWKSDGTVSGTSLYNDINLGLTSSYPIFGVVYNGQQYFNADDGDNSNGYYDLYKLGTTLPITLLNFSALLKNNDAVLSWQTATEYNVTRFVIQRSKDGTNFSDIAFVNARNTGVQQQQYAYTDQDVFAGMQAKFYYRLKTLDKDGKFSLSKIVELSKSGTNISISISPNPVKNILTINYNSGKMQSGFIRITDAAGKVLYTSGSIAGNSAGQEIINVSRFSKGIYYLQIINGQEKKSVSFIKE